MIGTSPRARDVGDAELVGKVIGVVLFFVIGYVIYSWDDWGDNVALADLPTASWMDEDTRKWPKMVLSNEARFRGHSDLGGGTSFLISHGAEGDEEEIVGATARHLLTDVAGVEPDVPLRRLDAKLTEWFMYPVSSTRRKLEFSGLHGSPSSYGDADALFLTMKSTADRLPVTPLEVFKGKVKAGEVAYLVVVPYLEGSARQEVYPGKVTSVSAKGEMITITIDESVDATGFSGAPVLNEKGYVIGILTGTFPFAEDDEGRARVYICEGMRPLRGLFRS